MNDQEAKTFIASKWLCCRFTITQEKQRFFVCCHLAQGHNSKWRIVMFFNYCTLPWLWTIRIK